MVVGIIMGNSIDFTAGGSISREMDYVLQLSDMGAREFARELAAYCRAYNLDGVAFDDEYSNSPDLSNPWLARPSAYVVGVLVKLPLFLHVLPVIVFILQISRNTARFSLPNVLYRPVQRRIGGIGLGCGAGQHHRVRQWNPCFRQAHHQGG